MLLTQLQSSEGVQAIVALEVGGSRWKGLHDVVQVDFRALDVGCLGYFCFQEMLLHECVYKGMVCHPIMT